MANNSQEAKVNMAKLMQYLRPYWENSANMLGSQDEEMDMLEGGVSDYLGDSKSITLMLLNQNGEQQHRSLNIDKSLITKVITDRISIGVENFFESMLTAFNLPENSRKVDYVKILLAGNSSKSPILLEVFEQTIQKYQDIIQRSNPEIDDLMFTIYPLLGTYEAREIQGTNLVRALDESSLLGKLGAYGILKARAG